MRPIIVLAALTCAVASASIVTSDQILIDVGPAELVHNVLGPGSVMWRIPVIVSARLTNTGTDGVLLNSIGGGSGLYPPTQIYPSGEIAPGASIAGPMFAADIAAYLTDGPNLTNQQVIDGISGSAYGIYRLDGTPLEDDWLVPPAGQGTQPPVAIHRSIAIPTQNEAGGTQGDPGPVSTPEPSTFALCAVGIAGAAYGALRRRLALAHTS